MNGGNGARWLYRTLRYRRLGRCVRAKSTRPGGKETKATSKGDGNKTNVILIFKSPSDYLQPGDFY